MSSGAVWAALGLGAASLLQSLAAWLRASAAHTQAQVAAQSAAAAHVRIDNLTPGPSVKAQP